MQPIRTVIPFLALFLAMGLARASSPLEVWRGRNPLPTGEQLRRAASANGITLLAGGSGTNMLVVSTDATNWIVGGTTGTRSVNELIYANGLWVAAADGAIATSADGTNWTPRLVSFRNYLGVAQGNGRFVAVSTTGIAISTDGLVWSEPLGGIAGNAITFAFGKFFIGSSYIRVSSDGSSWTEATNTFGANVTAFAFGDGRLVGLGSTGRSSWTTDGFTWSYSTMGSLNWTSAAHGNGLFVGAFNSGAIMTSTNGSNWIQRNVANLALSGVSFVNGQFILAGSYGQILSSWDGTNWTARHTMEGISLVRRIAYLNNRYVAVGDQAMIMTSPDGTQWKLRPVSSSAALRAVAFGEGWYLAGGSSSFITSTNGTNWSPNGSGLGINGLAYGNGLFVALTDGSGGMSPGIRTTVDGTNWLLRTNLTAGALNDVTFSNGLFVAVGSGARILTSTNGVHWIQRPVGSNLVETFKAVTCGNGRFYALGLGRLAYSYDGTNWSLVGLPPMASTEAVAAGEGCVVIVDSQLDVWFSHDLRSWTNTRLRSGYGDIAAAHGPGKFVLGGFPGQIWESAPVLRLTPGTPGLVFVTGPPQVQCEIQRHTDLGGSNWVSFGSVTLSNTPSPWFDPQLNPPPRALYRARLLSE